MANLKISQVEKTTNMDADAYILVVQNGKNYRMSIKEAIAANVDLGDVDLSNYFTKEETVNIINDSVETQSDKIDKLENIVQNINKDVAVEEDADATFDGIFVY